MTANHPTHARSQITARPHPYLSHANDHVRSYLLSRIKSLDSDIEIIDDLDSTVVYSRPGASVYFEGTNILVKIPGSGKHESNAVLFSAHYDSVSSAPGATDNGIGAVAALHFLEWVMTTPGYCSVLTVPTTDTWRKCPGTSGLLGLLSSTSTTTRRMASMVLMRNFARRRVFPSLTPYQGL